MLVVTLIWWPSMTKGLLMTSSSCCAIVAASTTLPTPSIRIANSSPPSRAITSPVRTWVLEPLGDFLQELVAGVVAERVVDHLELVDVEEEQRHLAAVAARARGGALELVVEILAVADLGERVELREVVQPQLGALALDGVADGAQDRAALAFPLHQVVLHALVEDADRELLVVLAARARRSACGRPAPGWHPRTRGPLASGRCRSSSTHVEGLAGHALGGVLEGTHVDQLDLAGLVPSQRCPEKGGIVEVVFNQQQLHGFIGWATRAAEPLPAPPMRICSGQGYGRGALAHTTGFTYFGRPADPLRP